METRRLLSQVIELANVGERGVIELNKMHRRKNYKKQIEFYIDIQDLASEALTLICSRYFNLAKTHVSDCLIFIKKKEEKGW